MYPGDIVSNKVLKDAIAKKKEKKKRVVVHDEREELTVSRKIDSPTSGDSSTVLSLAVVDNGSLPYLATTNDSIIQPTLQVKKELELSSGFAILDYAYKHYVFDGPTISGNMNGGGGVDDYGDGSGGGYTLSFFGIGIGIGGGGGQKKDLGLFEKKKRMAYLEAREENVRNIDREFLKKHGITLEILLTKCNVPITDLKSAGIVSCFEDLAYLSYEHKNLTLNRQLFNVGHMVQLFQMDATSLMLDITDVILCQFLPAELLTLHFSLPLGIEEGRITSYRFSQLRYNARDLGLLGIRARHLQMLGITRDIALNKIRWSMDDYNELMNQ